jgi:hypothetical protein
MPITLLEPSTWSQSDQVTEKARSGMPIRGQGCQCNLAQVEHEQNLFLYTLRHHNLSHRADHFYYINK